MAEILIADRKWVTDEAVVRSAATLIPGAKINGVPFDGSEDITIPSGAASINLMAMLPASGWRGSSPPYVQAVGVLGLIESDNPIIDIVLSGVIESDNAMLDAWALVSRIVSGENEIAATCYDSVPGTDISLQLKVVR